MPLTTEERAAINRRNAQNSRGPTSTSGKSASRANALKHGLRAEVLPMPGEDPEDVARRAAGWYDYYRPQSPAAEHLVDEYVRASLMARRVAALQSALAEAQFQKAKDALDRAIDEQVGRLRTEPLEAVEALRSTAAGCRWLVAQFEEVAAARNEWGGLDEPALSAGITLFGGVQSSVYARELRAMNLFADPRQPRDRVELVSPDGARARLDELFTTRLSELRAEAAQLAETVEAPVLAQAAALSLLPDDPTTARLLLRYQSEARTTFHRALKALETTLKRDEAEGRREDDEAVEAPHGAESHGAAVPPNEPKPAAVASPNEPKRAAVRPPNKVDLTSPGASGSSFVSVWATPAVPLTAAVR